MKNAESQEPLDIVRKLVAAEEEYALRRFHRRAFGSRIKALVQAEEKNLSRSSPWRRIPVAAWTGAALLAVMVVIALTVFITRSPQLSPGQILENFFTQTPGARTLLDRTVAAVNGTEIRPSSFESAISKTLDALSMEPAARAPRTSEKAPLSAGPETPRLGLEKTYEILIGEKSIERVLSTLKKIKEV